MADGIVSQQVQIVRPRLLDQAFHERLVLALHHIADDADELELRRVILRRQLAQPRHLAEAGVAVGRPYIDHGEFRLGEDLLGNGVPIQICSLKNNENGGGSLLVRRRGLRRCSILIRGNACRFRFGSIPGWQFAAVPGVAAKQDQRQHQEHEKHFARFVHVSSSIFHNFFCLVRIQASTRSAIMPRSRWG